MSDDVLAAATAALREEVERSVESAGIVPEATRLRLRRSLEEKAKGRRRASGIIVVFAVLFGGTAAWAWGTGRAQRWLEAATSPAAAPQVAAAGAPAPRRSGRTSPGPSEVAPGTVAPAAVAPTPLAPTPLAPAPVAPTPVAPTPVAPAREVAPTPSARTPVAPAQVAREVAPTPSAPSRVARTPVARTPSPSRTDGDVAPERAPKTAVSVEPSGAETGGDIAAPTQPAVTALPPTPVERLYRAAHDLHFHGGDAVKSLAAWDAYLAAEPTGRFVVEAKYNRALVLVRLKRYDEARVALSAFANGEVLPRGYRQAAAKQLMDRLPK